MHKEIYGSTGTIGIDGLLTPELYETLNRLQNKAAETVHNHLDKRKEGEHFPLVAMATGIGKGRIIHLNIEKQIRKKPDSKVLIIAGTKVVLVKQTHAALEGYQQAIQSEDDYVNAEEDEELTQETTDTDFDLLNEQKSFLYKTGKYGQKDANVHVATIQTIQSEVQKGSLDPSQYDLVIVDEVHNIGTPKRKETIEKFDRVYGLTATPFRHTGNLKKPEQYGFEIIESLTLPEAQEMRLLPPLLGIQIDTTELVDEIPTTPIGKIDYKKLGKLLKKSTELRPYIANKIADIICDNEGNKYKTVVAVNFVWEAQEIAKLLHDKGIKVGIAVNQAASKKIHTDEIPALNTIEKYKLPDTDPDSIQVLISPYVASEGFDAPFTEILAWASPTDSPLRYTQYTGRLARRADGKLFGVVADFLFQTKQYGWSYNMGMWMKGDVRQLDNGMLWLGPETDIDRLKNVHSVQSMSKHSDLKRLSELQFEHHPPPEGWALAGDSATEGSISHSLEKTKPWVLSRIPGIIIQLEEEHHRRNEKPPELAAKFLSRKNKVETFYAPIVIERLRTMAGELQEAPEGWMVVGYNKKDGKQTGICAVIGRTESWIVPRLPKVIDEIQSEIKTKGIPTEEQEPLSGEYLEASSRVPFVHYAPDVVRRLKELAENDKNAPPGWMPVGLDEKYGMSKEIARSQTWIRNRLDEAVRRITSEKEQQCIPAAGKESLSGDFLDQRKRPKTLYSPEVIEMLRKIAEEEGKSAPTGWMHVGDKDQSGISNLLNQSGGWVSSKIPDALAIAEQEIQRKGNPSEEREQLQGNYRMHTGTITTFYSPLVIEKLQEMAERRREAPEGWMIAGDIRKEGTIGFIIGKSKSWMKVRLPEVLEIIRQQQMHLHEDERVELEGVFLNNRGSTSTFYSPEVIKILRKMADNEKLIV